MKMAKKNTKKRKRDKVEKTAVVLLDDIAHHKNMLGTASTKKE